MRGRFLPFIGSRKNLIVLMFLSTLMLYFIFSPAVNILYYAADDFRYAGGGLNKACVTDDGFEFVMTLGRPIQAYIDCWSYKFAFTLERMRVLRLISICVMGCAMGLIIDYLVYLGMAIGSAVFAGSIFLLMQHFYNPSIYTGSTPLPFALVLVLIAYRCISLAETMSFSNVEKNRKITLIGMSGVLILSAMLTYPAVAFFFVTLSLLKVLFSRLSNWEETRRNVIYEVVLYGAVSVFYFIGTYVNMHYFPRAPIPPFYQLTHPNLNILEMMNRLMVLSNVFSNIWALTPLSNTIMQGYFAITFISCGVLFGMIRVKNSPEYLNNKRTTLFNLAQLILAVAALIILCNSFQLIIPSQYMEGRIMIGTISAGLALLIWAIHQTTISLPGSYQKIAGSLIFGCLFTVLAYQTNISMISMALGYEQRLYLPKLAIADYLAKGETLRRIHFIVPRTYYPYDNFFLANVAFMQVLGNNGDRLKWCSLARGVPGEEKDHQTEALTCINGLPENGVAVTYSFLNEPYVRTPNMQIIDMQDTRAMDYAQNYMKRFFNTDKKINNI